MPIDNAVLSNSFGSLMSGAGVPAADKGEVGDLYFDTAANTFYGPKTSNGWESQISAVGPKGPQGDSGPKGDKGDQGDVGPIGPIGLTGPKGDTGAQGEKGDPANFNNVLYRPYNNQEQTKVSGIAGMNYQGVLTDEQGAPASGNRTFDIKFFDEATGGTELYQENIGELTLTNGAYSFEFGTAGTSHSMRSEILMTTDGTSSTYQKVLSVDSVANNSLSVTDGNYTWSQTSGSSNENDFGVTYNSSLRRVTVTYYNAAPTAGRSITATYRTPESGITGALQDESQPWVEVIVNGIAQSPRQKVLAVPFATFSSKAAFADSVDERNLVIPTSTLSRLIDEVAFSGVNSSFYRTEDFPLGPSGRNKTVQTSSLEMTWDDPTDNMTTRALVRSGSKSGGAYFDQTWPINGPVDSISLNAIFVSFRVAARLQFIYEDGSVSSEIELGSSNNQIISNPDPSKIVKDTRVWSWQTSGYSDSFDCSLTPNYRSATARSIVIQLPNILESTFGLRTMINGSASSGKLFSDCVNWKVVYLDGSESQSTSIGAELLWSDGKIPSAIKVSTIPSQLQDDSIDISRIVVRLISKN